MTSQRADEVAAILTTHFQGQRKLLNAPEDIDFFRQSLIDYISRSFRVMTN